ncbi:MAG TPA: histidine kinase [Puia sp.]|nr:histidine kinase [Puia sp.]
MHRLTLIPLILITISCYCQELSYKQFTVKDGLPGSIVYNTLQDKNGFIWFATNQGVSRFDGRTFRNYTKEDGLPDNDILKLYLDKYNNVWVISFLGVPAVFCNNSIIRFDSCRGVRSVCEDRLTDSIVLMMADFTKNSGGLCGYYRSVNKPGRWKFTSNLRSLEHVCNFPILRASTPGNIDFYFSCKEDDTQILSLKNGVTEQHYCFKAINRNRLSFCRQQYFSLTSDQKGIVFISDDSLFYADFYQIIPVLSLRSLGMSNTVKDDINNIFYENDSTLWLCSRSQGLLCIKNFLTDHKTVHAYFTKSFCTSIIKDQENGYWLTTHSDGVYYLPNLCFYSVSAFPDLATKSVRCIHLLDRQKVAAGFSNGNIMIIDNDRLSSRVLSQWVTGNKNNRILDIRPFVHHTLLAGTDAGLYQISSQGSGKILGCSMSIKELFVQSDSIIIGGTSEGVWLLRADGRSKKAILSTRATCVAGLHQDYYCGSLQGMYFCRGDSICNAGKKYPPLSGIINHIDIAPDSSIWVSTEQGIVILKEGALSILKEQQGLTSNLCKHISFDKNTAWVSTDKGISRIDYQWRQCRLDYSISTITEEDGLTADDVNQTVPGGEYIWAATARGISFFSKNYISHSVWQPLINITRIVAGDTLLATTDTIALDYRKKRLLIELSGISYRSGKQIRYEYRLKGLENSWSRISNNSIEFPALPFGRYVIEVRAIDRWGKKSGHSKCIFIIHPPPFWQSTWFFLSSYLVMALLIGAGFYVFHRRRQQKREEEYRLEKKMQDLEMMALRAQMNPHFIFNCLTSIQYHIIRADIRNASAYLHKFSTLIRQTLQNSASSMISLREEIKLLRLYLDLEKLRFGDRMDYRIDLSADLKPDDHFIPSMIIQPYVENAIKHGIATLEDSKGIILIRFNRAGQYIECIIDDNGPGIDASRHDNHSQDTGYQSMGTRITENRIHTINTLQKDKIRILVTDKQKSGLFDNGTLIHLSFPITTD